MPELIASGQLPLYDYNDAIIAGAAPVNPSPDTLWLDNSVEPNMMKRWDGLTWEPVGELDPTYSETITAIETTLANMADDGLLDYSDRQKLKEDIALITGATPADAATLPTGATLDGGTVGSYRRIRKAAVSAGMLTSHAAYTALATAYTTLSTFLNARTPKPWDVSLANKATPTPVDKATFRSAWLGYYNAETALADETTATLSSGINTLKNTTIPALENKALSEAEKSAIQTSLNLIVKEKSDLDATSSSYQSNANLIDKTLVSTPKTAYDTSYNALLAAMNDVLDEPTGAAIADAKITAVNTQFTDYGTKLAALRTGFQNAQKAIETKLGDDAETAISTALVDYVDKTSYGLDIQQIQNQVDGSIMTHFGANEPTLMNTPASAWTTTVDKDIHLGDLYYDTVSGFAYRFAKTDTVYNWMRIVDTDVTLALQNASTAQDTADAKRRAFYATPTPPYDLGDLWVQGTGGDLMRCTTAKAAGGSYAAGDWSKAVKYTDDTTVNNLEIGGQNIVPQASIALSGSTLSAYDVATNTWTLSITTGTARGGFTFTGQNVRIPYGKTYLLSFEVQSPYATTFNWDVNNFPIGATAWNGNDNDNGALRKNSGTTVAANQWVKCWYLFTNTHASNTTKVDLYDNSIFGVNNSTGSTQLVKFRNIKGEFGNRPTEWQPALVDLNASITQAKTDAQTYATTYITNNVQPQIDGKIETFAQTTDPSTAWADAATKTLHSGDIWYNTTNKETKRWSGTAWVTLEDIVANNAAALAATKNKIFTATPTIPYKAGDFWINNQELYVSSVTRDTGSYTAGDWTKAVKYTDDTAAAAAAQAASDAQADADTANTTLTEIASDDKLTAVEKQAARNEWNALVSEAALHTTQAGTFGLSPTPYQNAFASLGTYLNGGTSLTYSALTSGTIPGWINDANLGTTTTIVGATYRSTWKAFYDARVTLLNAIAAKSKELADNAQSSIDNLVVDGSNWIDNSDFSKTLDTSGEQGYTTRGAVTLAIQSGQHPEKNNLAVTFPTAGVSGSVDAILTMNETLATATGEFFAFSFEAKASVSTNFSIRGSSWNSEIQTKAITTDWARYSVLLPVQTTTTTKTLVFWISNAATLQLTKIKFERGTKATAWTPSIRDVATTIQTAQTAAENAQTSATTANTTIGEITSDNKLTGNEKSGIRLEWNALTSQAVANSTQASTFGISATNYQNAIAALGTYLNGGTALTYAQCTGGTIPLWIADANLGITTTIVGATYRTTWKTYYDAQVALMNAVAAKARELANTAQQTADGIQVGGRNLAKETIIPLTGASGAARSYPLTVAAQDFSGKKVVISCDVEWTNKVDGTRLGAEIALSSVEGTVYIGVWNSPSNASSGKTRISNIVSVPVRTYTAIASCASYIQMNATGTKVSNLKVEFANKPSDWSPAPEDVAKDISDVENFASSLQDLTDVTFKDGLIETSESSAIAEHLNTLAKETADLSNQYDTIYVNVNLVGTPKTNLATAKTNYTTSYNSLVSSINAAISDNRTTTAEKAAVDAAFSSYKDNLKVLTQRLQEAQTSIANKLAADTATSLKSYVQSRGENLVTNGTGLLGNNTNFSSFAFDGYDNYGSKGSFTTSAYNNGPAVDELIPVDPEKSYRMTWYGKTNPYVGAKFFGYATCFDSDGLQIFPDHTMYIANTLTTLSQALNPGDTVIRLTSAANWKNSVGAAVHQRKMIMWNYTNASGYTYPELTYSRNTSPDNTWLDGGVDYATNTITLRVPWAGAIIPAGTKVSNSASGGTYKYIAGGNVIVPSTWTKYTGTISGIDTSGNNDNNKFHPGTSFAKIGWLVNREINGGKFWLSNVSFGVDSATQASLDALSETTTGLSDYVDGAFHDSVIQEAEAVAIEKHLTDLAKENADMGNQYNTLYNNANVTGTAKTNLASAKTAYDTQYTAVTGAVNTAISDGKASDAEKTSVSNAFIAYRDALKLLTQRMQEAQIAISDYLSTQKANAISIGGRNMVVSGTLTSNKYVSETNGTVLVDTGNGHDVTDFIPCDASTAYMLSTKIRLYQIRVAYYNASKVFISGALYGLDQGKQKAVSTPATTAFMRWSGDRANGDALTLWKLEKGNKATDWTPAPEDVSAQIAASNTNINNLRQSLDSKRDIRLGMKLGFSAFATTNANYIYFCGLGTNATTFAEELSDTDGSLYDRGTQTTLIIPKQALNLTGLAAGTSGYLVWNSSDGTNKIWFITLQNTYDASGTMTASKWMKRNIGATGDNTEMVLTDAVYVLGELEI